MLANQYSSIQSVLSWYTLFEQHPAVLDSFEDLSLSIRSPGGISLQVFPSLYSCPPLLIICLSQELQSLVMCFSNPKGCLSRNLLALMVQKVLKWTEKQTDLYAEEENITENLRAKLEQKLE